jgi:hypothetical protein
MTDAEALAILRGSPSGTTEAMFESLGVPRKQLDRLVKAGKARIEHKVLAKPSMVVPWFYPTGKEST